LGIRESGDLRIFAALRRGCFDPRLRRRRVFPGYRRPGMFLFMPCISLGRNNHDFRLRFFRGSRYNNSGGDGFFLNHNHFTAFSVFSPSGNAFSILRLMIIFHMFNEFNLFGFLGTI
jgi:hypothetical protein